LRHTPTFRSDSPTSRAIRRFGNPSAAASTTRARVTIRCSLRGERTIANSNARSSSLNSIRTATSGIHASKLNRIVEPGFADHAAHPSLCTQLDHVLVEELRDSEQALGVNELARRIGVNASTTSRLLATLEAHGMVSAWRPCQPGPTGSASGS